MDTYESKVDTFIDYLKTHTQLQMTSDVVQEIKNGLLHVKFEQLGGARRKKINGYNLFMKNRMEALKTSVPDSNTRMSRISTEWNALAPEGKEEWKTQAKNVVSIGLGFPIKIRVKKEKSTKVHKMSGYQVFVSEQMPSLTELKPKERMTKIGQMWSQTPPEQKDEYKLKAEKLNATRAQTETSSVVV